MWACCQGLKNEGQTTDARHMPTVQGGQEMIKDLIWNG